MNLEVNLYVRANLEKSEVPEEIGSDKKFDRRRFRPVANRPL
jgi:hypothetical protein